MIHVIHQIDITRFVGATPEGRAAPFRPWAAFGCGTALCFHRCLEPGVYLADVWVTLLFLPVLPLSTWVILPRMRTSRQGAGFAVETFHFEFVGRLSLTPVRLLAMLSRGVGRVTSLLGPVIAAFLYAVWGDGGKPDHLKMLLVLASLVWAMGLSLVLAARRDRIYERAWLSLKPVRRQAVGPPP